MYVCIYSLTYANEYALIELDMCVRTHKKHQIISMEQSNNWIVE